MKEAKISDIKKNLGRYPALVRRGEVVRILVRDRPVAQIVPISEPVGGPAEEKALAEMERRGLIRRGSGRVDREIVLRNPPGKPCGVLEALLEERKRR